MHESFMTGNWYFEFKSKQSEAPPPRLCTYLLISHRDESAEKEGLARRPRDNR